MEINDCNQDCINTAGGYDCMCFEGYFLDTSNDACEGMFSYKKRICEKISDYYNCNNRKKQVYIEKKVSLWLLYRVQHMIQ